MHGEPEFEVTRRRTQGGVVVVVRGEIDVATIDVVETQLAEAIAESTLVYLDLREVTFVDSAGIRLVVEAARELGAKQGEIVVVRGPAAVQRVFDLVGLEGRVRMVDAPPGE
jgi:anti-anti-sigma factor